MKVQADVILRSVDRLLTVRTRHFVRMNIYGRLSVFVSLLQNSGSGGVWCSCGRKLTKKGFYCRLECTSTAGYRQTTKSELRSNEKKLL